jgi:thiamine biosynthesis lipoprotein
MNKFLVILLLLTSLPCSAEWFKQNQGIMGTNISVELWAEEKTHADKCIARVMDEM